MVDEDLVWIPAVAVTQSVAVSARGLALLLLLSTPGVSISAEVFGKLDDDEGSSVFGNDCGGRMFPCTTCAAVRRLFISMPSSLRASLQVRPICNGLTQYLQVRI